MNRKSCGANLTTGQQQSKQKSYDDQTNYKNDEDQQSTINKSVLMVAQDEAPIDNMISPIKINMNETQKINTSAINEEDRETIVFATATQSPWKHGVDRFSNQVDDNVSPISKQVPIKKIVKTIEEKEIAHN